MESEGCVGRAWQTIIATPFSRPERVGKLARFRFGKHCKTQIKSLHILMSGAPQDPRAKARRHLSIQATKRAGIH